MSVSESVHFIQAALEILNGVEYLLQESNLQVDGIAGGLPAKTPILQPYEAFIFRIMGSILHLPYISLPMRAASSHVLTTPLRLCYNCTNLPHLQAVP